MSPNRIEKSILLRAPLARVWRALTDSKEFGDWFGMSFDGPFMAGAKVAGTIEPTKVNPDVAKAQEPYRGITFNIFIESIEPQRLFSYRWHPCRRPNVDYSSEPTTLVEFTLEEVADGVLLTVVESGFEHLPPERRTAALRDNEGGWSMAVTLIAAHLQTSATN